MTGLLRSADELVARIGNERRSGIGYQRYRSSFPKPLQKPGSCCRGVVVVIGCEWGSDGISIEQFTRHPRILAGNEVGGREGRQSAQGDVAEIADRGGHNMKPRREWRRLHAVAVKTIASVWSIGVPRQIRVHVAHERHRKGNAAAGHGCGELRIFLARLTIRRQNDRLALPYRSRA
jgi:hypothetical protein